MDRDSATGSEGGTDDEDRVVSRRVEHPTRAEAGHEAAYEAADPLPDGDDPVDTDPGGDDPGGSERPARSDPGTVERAAAEMPADESEPTRSE